MARHHVIIVRKTFPNGTSYEDRWIASTRKIRAEVAIRTLRKRARREKEVIEYSLSPYTVEVK